VIVKQGGNPRYNFNRRPLPPIAYNMTELIYASKTKRLINFLVDSILILIIFLALLYLAARLILESGIPSYLEIGRSYSIEPFFLFIMFSYYLIFEGIFETTPGKLITKTKIIKHNGEKVRFGDLILRTLIRIIPFDPFSFLTKDSYGWHDKLSKTRIINNN